MEHMVKTRMEWTLDRAGRQKAKMSNNQASLGQAFQLRQMANEILTNVSKSCRNIDQASHLIDFVTDVALGIDIR
jgi:hypothetical protein